MRLPCPHYDDYLISDRLPDQDGIKLSRSDVSILSAFYDKDSDKDKQQTQPTVISTNQLNEPNEPKTNMTEPINSSLRTPHSEPMMTILQQQYDLAVQSNLEK